MGQDLGMPAAPAPGTYNPVGQGMGRYQEGTAPQIGNDPKAKMSPAPIDGMSGQPLNPSLAQGAGLAPKMTGGSNDFLKQMIAQLLSKKRGF